MKRELFEHSTNEITIKTDANIEWIKFNKDQVGFYRVNYPLETWNAFGEALIKDLDVSDVKILYYYTIFFNRQAKTHYFQIMTAVDRASLVDDVFALADATQVRYGTAFDLTRYLVQETEFVPWEVASSKLLALQKKLYYTPEVYESYITYARELIDHAYSLVTDWKIGADFTKK